MLWYQNGFSLIELMIVIALLSLIAMLSIGSYHTFNRFLISSELNQLRLLLLCMRYKAMALHSTISILFNRTQQSYTLDNHTYYLQTASLNHIPGVMGPPAYPQQLITKSITFADDRITFYADGTMSAGTLYITDKQQSCMYALTIAVHDTANIRIYSYNKTWHLLA